MKIDIITIIILFVIGLTISPMLITTGLRLPKKQPEGKCPNCKEKYSLFNMIPILPYVINYGKCPYCNNKISVYYPISELLTGIIYSLSYVIYGLSYEMFTLILIFSLLVIIFISDLKYYIIQTKVIIVFTTTSLILKLLYYDIQTFLFSIISGVAIFVFIYLIKCLGDKVFKVESLGGGDVKLSLYFGILLGIRLAIVSIVLGAFLAFPQAVYYALTKKEREIPFGPFLITALLLVFIFMEPIRNFLTLLFTNY